MVIVAACTSTIGHPLSKSAIAIHYPHCAIRNEGASAFIRDSVHPLVEMCRNGSGQSRYSAFETPNQPSHVVGHRHFESHLTIVGRMTKRQPMCVQRLTWKRDRTQRVRPVDVAHFADQRV